MLQSAIEASRAKEATDARRLVVAVGERWNAVKVFTGPITSGENPIGEQVSAWLDVHRVHVVEVVMVQSSSAESGCISIGLFYRAPFVETPHNGRARDSSS